jgi:MFS family permease
LAGLLAAQTISPFGDAMATTALILHVQATTGSATAVGLLLFAQAFPPLAAPFAGVVADRFSPGRLLGVGWLARRQDRRSRCWSQGRWGRSRRGSFPGRWLLRPSYGGRCC